MVTIVWPLHAIVLHHTIIKGSLETNVLQDSLHTKLVPHLGVPAVRELHVGAAPLQARGVRHELGGAQSLHLLEELHRAARHVTALLQTLPKTQ